MAVREVDEDGSTLGHQLAVRQDQDRDLLHRVAGRPVLGRSALHHLVGLAQQQERRLDRDGAGPFLAIDHIRLFHGSSPHH